jgi:two-component system response regulator FixJ
MAVEAIKGGASAFLELPYDPSSIVMLIREHIKAWKLVRESNHHANVNIVGFPGAEQLTQRQREVLAEITTAASNKEAGRNLGLSPRTVEAHRARIMSKLGVKSTTALFQLVLGNTRRDNYN